MYRFRYYRRYIPTGEVSEGETDALSLGHMFEMLNEYNRLGNGQWQYWLESSQREGRPV